jgi:hypothetical protein
MFHKRQDFLTSSETTLSGDGLLFMGLGCCGFNLLGKCSRIYVFRIKILMLRTKIQEE